MDMAIRIDNRLFERRQEQHYHQRHSSSYAPATPITSHFRNQQQQPRFLKPDDLQLQVSTAPSSIYLLLDQLKIKQSYGYRLCAQRLTVFNGAKPSGKTRALSCCGKAGHRKANCPKSRFKFNSDSSKNIHAIQTETTKQQDSGKPIQFPLKKQLSSARQPSNFDTEYGYDENC
ncbi:hypothetical protein BASA81_018506 [Batrachochytrium salamandrivorans]|nr:hypothetical protein BASA81_018506 [Batrachochytrium salamandrivorans]